jgi:hypothetical protein
MNLDLTNRRIEPLVPSLHGAAIVKAFMREGEDPIFYPSGVPFSKYRSWLVLVIK